MRATATMLGFALESLEEASNSVTPFKDEDATKIRMAFLLGRVRHYRWDRLTLDQLEAVVAILPAKQL